LLKWSTQYVDVNTFFIMVLKIATYHNDKMIESVYGEIMNNNYKFAKIKPELSNLPSDVFQSPWSLSLFC